MNRKRVFAGLLAAVCAGSLLSVMPTMPEVSAQAVVCNDFERNYDGWYGTADAVVLTPQTGVGTNATRVMTVCGRSAAEEGAASEKRFYLVGETDYTYSVDVYSTADEFFRVEMTYTIGDSEETYTVPLMSGAAKAEKWTTLSGHFAAPADAGLFRITIRTDSTRDFSFDDVQIQQQGGLTASAATAEKGLKDEFAPYFRVGNILNGNTVKNAGIIANILKDCNSVECENETKPSDTLVQSQCSGTNIAVSLSRCAAIMDFCVQNNLGMRGHTLVWHSQTPDWFFKQNFSSSGGWVDKDTMDARMESYIKNMFGAIQAQYPDLDLYAYDVCNECVSDSEDRTRNYGGAREPGYDGGKSPWVQIYGSNSFVETAFTYARLYAPKGCDLYYNDYNEYWDHKRDCIYDMCKDLYSKGLLDGVGMQSHVPANATGFAGTDSYIEAMKKYLSIGCDVQITELDISLLQNKVPTYSYSDQAAKYCAIFKAAMDWNKNPASTGRVTAVCIWGPNDANSWLESGSNALLYDANNQPKQAYNDLIAMIPQSEWGDGSNYSGGPSKIEPNEYGWYFHSTFEGTTDNWQKRGESDILTSGRTAYVGDEALLVENRTAAWNGASINLNPRAFVPGETYSFSVNVNYFDGDDTDQFYLKLQYVDGDGKTQYATVAEGIGAKNTWVQLANKEYTIPADATSMQLYVETAETTNNFYIDEAIGAVGGTTILGAGEYTPAQPVIPGDLDGSGVINGFDMALARQGILSGFADANAEKAADVDESGVADVTDLVLLQKYLLGIIVNFPKAEKIIDTAAMEQIFSAVKPAGSYKADGENNPLYTQRFGADPGVMTYDGRVYVYMTNDVFEYDAQGNVVENTYGLIDKINCISSDDLVNWTDHGAIPVAGSNGIAKFANNSWAPCAAHKTIGGKEKFFLYFCNGGNGVCVLTADSPTGPWSDPLGKPLVTRSVPTCGDIPWLFDPAVFVDDDGTGYLAFGGGVPKDKTAMPGTSRIVKLGNDMISLAGTPQIIDAPYLFEDSGINKIGNTYYYTYCSNWETNGNAYGLTSGAIEYMTADNPLGPYTYGGELFRNQGVFFGDYGNNHHSIAELDGTLYLFYHARPVERAMGKTGNYRSPMVNEMTMNGTQIQSVKGTMTAVAARKKLNPYATVQAETMSNQSNDITVDGLGDTVVTGQAGSWFKVTNVDCSKGGRTITVKATAPKGAVIKVSTKQGGTAAGYVEIPAGSAAQTVTVPLNLSSGTNDLYFLFSNEVSVDSWKIAA